VLKALGENRPRGIGGPREVLERPGMGRARVQRIQRRADDAIAHPREPSGAARALLVHVEAQDFDEQHFGELREHTGATWPRRARFGQGIADGRFEPDAGIRAAHVDPHERGQPCEQHPREAHVAGEVAADEACRRPAAAVRDLPRTARQHFVQARAFRRREAGLRAHPVRVALRKDDHVPGDEMHRRLAVHLDVALAFGDEMEDHDLLGTGLEQRRRGVGPG